MNTFKGTPGPWERNNTAIETVARPSLVVGMAYDYEDLISWSEAEANAALIAQAPAMLAALTKLLDAVRTNVPGRSVLEDARPKTADEIFAEAGHQAVAVLEALREGGAL